jgi:hypothetical protein
MQNDIKLAFPDVRDATMFHILRGPSFDILGCSVYTLSISNDIVQLDFIQWIDFKREKIRKHYIVFYSTIEHDLGCLLSFCCKN